MVKDNAKILKWVVRNQELMDNEKKEKENI